MAEATAAPAAPSNADDEYFWRHPIRYRANGGEKVITSRRHVERALSSLDGARMESFRLRQELDAAEFEIAQLKAKIREMTNV